MQRTIEAIVQSEWTLFQKIHHSEGEAPCQEDLTTFVQMRASQFLTWDRPSLESYLSDLCCATSGGANLLQEKYARMLRYTDPESYERILECLPTISSQKELLIEKITSIQLPWKKEFVERFPILAARSRTLLAAQDILSETSFESYLKGELYTYSEKTLSLYAGISPHLASGGDPSSTLLRIGTARFDPKKYSDLYHDARPALDGVGSAATLQR